MTPFEELRGIPLTATSHSNPIGPIYHMSCRTDVSSGTTLAVADLSAWLAAAVKKLESLGRLQKGWDSHGGRPLNSQARGLTVHTLGRLNKYPLPVPAVALDNNGCVQIEWKVGGRELDLDVGDRDIGYVKYDQDGSVQEGLADEGDDEELNSLTNWLLRK